MFLTLTLQHDPVGVAVINTNAKLLPRIRSVFIFIIATVLIIIGVILIGREEQARMLQEMHLEESKKKHRFGALALFFPIICAFYLDSSASFTAARVTPMRMKISTEWKRKIPSASMTRKNLTSSATTKAISVLSA